VNTAIKAALVMVFIAVVALFMFFGGGAMTGGIPGGGTRCAVSTMPAYEELPTVKSLRGAPWPVAAEISEAVILHRRSTSDTRCY